MEGYLLKWTNFIFGWQRRYFILHGGVLHYCKEKGSAQRGAIHLDISEIQKHPSNLKRFSISTGITSIYLKAYTKDESEDWFRALKEQQLDLKFTKTPMDASTVTSVIMDKVQAMWGIHSQLLSSIELIPQRSSNTNLNSLINLLQEMTKISANTLGIIENEHQTMRRSPNKMNRFSCEGAPFDDEGSEEDLFEDAVGAEELVAIRRCLPVLRVPRKKNLKNLWERVKTSIGNRFREISVPIELWEPLSMLQRIAEEVEYYKVLVEADGIEDPAKRLAYVAAFFICGHWKQPRSSKPFNAFPGETFELRLDGLQLLIEQLTDDLSALHCTHNNFTYWNNTELISQHNNGQLEVTMLGPCHLTLHKSQDTYTWSRPSLSFKDLNKGHCSVSYEGEIRITCERPELVAVVQFDQGKVKGFVLQGEEKVWEINSGELVEIKGRGETVCVSEGSEGVEGSEYFYGFSLFALQLNLPVVFIEGLPMSDSRCRRDIRALENGEVQTASKEYESLTTKSINSLHKPKWFDQTSSGWEYNRKYWESLRI